jgi:hypothetical protein
VARDPAKKKASKLRAKVRAGVELTDAEKAHLDAHPAKPGLGRPPKAAKLEVDGPPGAPADSAAPELDLGDADVAPEFATPAGETPAPETPRIKPRQGAARSGGKTGSWRDKYRAGQADGEREATCLEIAELWKVMMHKANTSIVANGGVPAVATEMIDGPLLKMAVLTVDKLLPSDFTIGPEVQVVGASSVTTAQCWWQARKVKRGQATSRTERAYVNPDPTPTEERAEGTNGTALSIVRAPQPFKRDEDSLI